MTINIFGIGWDGVWVKCCNVSTEQCVDVEQKYFYSDNHDWDL